MKSIVHPIVPHFIPYCLNLSHIASIYPVFLPYKKTDIILYLALFIQLYLILSHISSVYPHFFLIKKNRYHTLFGIVHPIVPHFIPYCLHLPHSFLIKNRYHTLFGIVHSIVPHFIPYCLHLPPFFPYKKNRYHTLFGIVHPIVPYFIPYCLHLPPFFPYKKTQISYFIWHCSSNCTSFYPILPPFTPILFL